MQLKTTNKRQLTRIKAEKDGRKEAQKAQYF